MHTVYKRTLSRTLRHMQLAYTKKLRVFTELLTHGSNDHASVCLQSRRCSEAEREHVARYASRRPAKPPVLQANFVALKTLRSS